MASHRDTLDSSVLISGVLVCDCLSFSTMQGLPQLQNKPTDLFSIQPHLVHLLFGRLCEWHVVDCAVDL